MLSVIGLLGAGFLAAGLTDGDDGDGGDTPDRDPVETGPEARGGTPGDDLLLGAHGGFDPATGSVASDVHDDGAGDALFGGDGDDTLVAGANAVLRGGAGDDTFVLGAWIEAGEAARIEDFVPGEDAIVLLFDAGSPAPPERMP